MVSGQFFPRKSEPPLGLGYGLGLGLELGLGGFSSETIDLEPLNVTITTACIIYSSVIKHIQVFQGVI